MPQHHRAPAMIFTNSLFPPPFSLHAPYTPPRSLNPEAPKMMDLLYTGIAAAFFAASCFLVNRLENLR